MTDDGRLLVLLATLGVAGAAAVRGSRGVVRRAREIPTEKPLVFVWEDKPGGVSRLSLSIGTYEVSWHGKNARYYVDFHARGEPFPSMTSFIGSWPTDGQAIRDAERDAHAKIAALTQGSAGVVRKGREAKPWTPKPGEAVGGGRWPLSSAHPDVWERPDSGIVLAKNDPRAWEDIIFPGLPSQEEVDQHLATLKRPALTSDDVPVAWSFASGKVDWESLKSLRPYIEDVAAWEEAREKARATYGSKGVLRRGRHPDAIPVILFDGDKKVGTHYALWAGPLEEFLEDNELTDAEKTKVRNFQPLFLGGGAEPVTFLQRFHPKTIKRTRKSLGLEPA
jgi:hypothetical protein